jgi:hypothetical protein
VSSIETAKGYGADCTAPASGWVPSPVVTCVAEAVHICVDLGGIAHVRAYVAYVSHAWQHGTGNSLGNCKTFTGTRLWECRGTRLRHRVAITDNKQKEDTPSKSTSRWLAFATNGPASGAKVKARSQQS